MSRHRTLADQLSRYEIDGPTGCWVWNGSRAGGRYGKFGLNGLTVAAHVAAWSEATGRQPESGEHVRHTCDRYACINPAHLVIGTHGDNMRDRNERGRLARGERQGSARLTEAGVRQIRTSYADGCGTFQSIARDFGVHWSTVARVVHRQSWRHVT